MILSIKKDIGSKSGVIHSKAYPIQIFASLIRCVVKKKKVSIKPASLDVLLLTENM